MFCWLSRWCGCFCAWRRADPSRLTTGRTRRKPLPPLELMAAGLALLALTAYTVLAGADFGGGVWDFFARGPRAHEQRAAIAKAMGPVWEANHVWLIFLLVLLFSGFPVAFSALSVAFFVPF